MTPDPHERTALILILRDRGYTLEEIASELYSLGYEFNGEPLSRERIRQIELRARAELRGTALL